MISFVDPRGVAGSDPLLYELAHPLEAGSTIGLMANGFPDSVAFLECVAAALSDELDSASFVRFDKGNASMAAPIEMLDEAAERCDVIVAAYGH